MSCFIITCIYSAVEEDLLEAIDAGNMDHLMWYYNVFKQKMLSLENCLVEDNKEIACAFNIIPVSFIYFNMWRIH